MLYEIELIINSRSLDYVYDDDTEVTITPNHLLFGHKLEISNTYEHAVVSPNKPEKRYKYIQSILTHFWNRWSKEYLTSLREHDKMQKSKRNINFPEEGDIVIIYEDKMPRQQWRLGRIVELLRSKDNAVRAAKVLVGRTRNVIERPVNKLYPLEKGDKHLDDESLETNGFRGRREAAVIGELRRKFANQ